MRQSSRKGTEVSKGVFQSIVEACMYCRRNRIASTLNIFSMAASLPVSSLNRRWIGPAMKSNQVAQPVETGPTLGARMDYAIEGAGIVSV
jgi:hypothetical protein